MSTLTDRAAWWKWRCGGLGASDIPALLGLSKWGSPFSVFCEKTGLIPMDDSTSDYADFGRYAEKMIGPWYTALTGLTVAGEQTWCTHPDESWMRCTVDGFVFESPNDETHHPDMALGPLEIKTRNPGRRYDELPDDIQAQTQWQMMVTGLPMAHVAVLHGRRLEPYELAADEADQAFILAQAKAFWHDHVLTGDPPPLDGHDATLAALAALHPEHTAKLERSLDGCADAVALLAEAKRWKAAAEGLEKSAKAVITWTMGPAHVGTIDGERALTLGSQTRKQTCKECGHVDESDPYRVLNLTGRYKP